MKIGDLGDVADAATHFVDGPRGMTALEAISFTTTISLIGIRPPQEPILEWWRAGQNLRAMLLGGIVAYKYDEEVVSDFGETRE